MHRPRLASHPEWLDLARSNLHRWSQLNQDAPALLECYEEWRQFLDRPIPEISAALIAPTDYGQPSSPEFALRRRTFARGGLAD